MRRLFLTISELRSIEFVKNIVKKLEASKADSRTPIVLIDGAAHNPGAAKVFEEYGKFIVRDFGLYWFEPKGREAILKEMRSYAYAEKSSSNCFAPLSFSFTFTSMLFAIIFG